MIKVEILDIWKNSETHPFSFLKTTGQVENKYSVLICPVLGWWGKNKQSTDATLHAVSFQVGQDRKKKKKKKLKTVHVAGLQSWRKINSMWKDIPHTVANHNKF